MKQGLIFQKLNLEELRDNEKRFSELLEQNRKMQREIDSLSEPHEWRIKQMVDTISELDKRKEEIKRLQDRIFRLAQQRDDAEEKIKKLEREKEAADKYHRVVWNNSERYRLEYGNICKAANEIKGLLDKERAKNKKLLNELKEAKGE